MNPGNYFKVYRSSYNKLNSIALKTNTNQAFLDENGNLTIDQGGADAFMNDVLNGNTNIPPNSNDNQAVRSIFERKQRLTKKTTL